MSAGGPGPGRQAVSPDGGAHAGVGPEFSAGSRGYLWERVLILRWNSPRLFKACIALPAGTLVGALVPRMVLGPGRDFPVPQDAVWIASVAGGLCGAVLPAVVGWAAGGMDAAKGADRIIDRSADPRRVRAARSVLRSGEPAGDAETDRIAAAMAGVLGQGPSSARRSRFLMIVSGALAAWQAVATVFAAVHGDVATALVSGAAALIMVAAVVGRPAEQRARLRRERVLALYAAEVWSGRVDEAVVRGLQGRSPSEA
ncbi:hypothetical protein GCM10023224_33340 [Streptomonospora halophila]|uniref:Uncharacterized protein n=2 Tax=Streptomonospora halophila TaxID=427369 RepID=A0ABP9GUL5_9ACTN